MGSIFMHNKHHRLSIKTHLDIFGAIPLLYSRTPTKMPNVGSKNCVS